MKPKGHPLKSEEKKERNNATILILRWLFREKQLMIQLITAYS